MDKWGFVVVDGVKVVYNGFRWGRVGDLDLEFDLLFFYVYW